MYKVAKGGAITINSYLNEKDRNIARDYIIKTASVNMREAAKIGLQSLYADPKDVLEKYKDFDIVKEMQARKGAKLLWVRARAIDADVVNANGDLFSKEELLKEVEIKGEKIPVYKTFEGVPIYTNHKNDDIEQAKGMVVYSEWNDEENCVYCTFFVDEEAYPDIARNIRTGVIHDVSMGASVEWGVCSICNNKAYTEKDYCEHLKKYKGKIYPETGKRAYEKNYGVKFIELSCVGDGAFESCEIQEIYDVDDVLSLATDLEKRASEVIAGIVLAHQGCPAQPNERKQYEDCLRVANSTASTATRLAQVAGTLVGGPLLAGQGANQNSTVAAVLQALGIDPRSGLNVLDLINLSLNFLEVAVMNMFARKDNVDLGHVGKITKSMADLQSTMQDMIDDGIDVGSGQAPQPINQPQQQQAQPQNLQPQQAQVGLADYSPSNNNIGKIMDFTNFSSPENSVGGGVALASSNINLVWASRDGKREVFASTNKSKNHFLNLAQSLLSLKENLSGTADINNSIQNVMRVANERNKNIKTNKPLEARSTNQMDHFAKIASEQRKKLAAAVTIDFKVEDNAGNRVVLSTDGTITGYTNGKRTSWEPILNESQLSSLENGHGTRVAADLLKDYGTFVKTALLDVKDRDGSRQEQLDEVRTGEGYDGKSTYDGLKAHHKGVSDKTRGEEVATKHLGTDEKVREELLAEAGLYGHKSKHEEITKSLSQLVDEVCKGVPTEVLEKQLEECRVGGKASAHEVMSSTIKALARSVVSAKETPSYIMKVAQMLSEERNLPEMIGAASSTVDMDADRAEKADFFNQKSENPDAVSSILKELGAAVQSDIKPIDLAEAIAVAVEEGTVTKEAVMSLAEVMLKNESASAEGMDVSATPSRAEELRAALSDKVSEDSELVDKLTLQAAISAMGQSADDMKVTPDEVAGTVEDMPQRDLVAAINRAKTVTSTEARLRARARREFWGIKTASSKDITSNVIGWLADYSLHFEISSTRIATAAKRLCAQGEVAEKLIEKAIAVKLKNERTAAMNVTQSKMECLRFVCTKEDLGGVNPSDDSFEETFKQKAIEVLQQHSFTVDPSTFSFTDLVVDADGNITASVSTNVTKTFNVDSVAEPVDMQPENEEIPVIMSDSAKFARKTRRDEVLSKYAMAPGMGAPAGAPGAAPAAPPAGPVGDLSAGANLGGGDLGVSGFTGGEMNQSPELDAMSEPGEKKPWGSVCPVCGSNDVDVAESKASCNSCGSAFEIEMMLKLISDGTGGMGKKNDDMVEEEAPLGGDTGLGAATAPPAPVAASSYKSMIRLSATVDSDVYLKTALPTFDKTAERMLPIGMVCPSCGNRHAHKVKDNTFCYKCGNYSKTRVAASKTDPTKLDVSITWID